MKAAMNTGFSVNIIFHFSGINAKEYSAGSYGSCMFCFYKRLPNCFPERLYQLTFLIAMSEGSRFSAFSPPFGMLAIFYLKHSEICIVICYRGFNFHFPKANDVECLFMCLFAIASLA